MIDKENQYVQISLKDYEELLELKYLFQHSTSDKGDMITSICNILKNRITLDTYDNSIVERKYNYADKALKELCELFRYTYPEVYESLIREAKNNKENDEREDDD